MANINKIRLSGTTYDVQDPNATKVVSLTQAQYDALVTKDANTIYNITDATAGDLSNYYTKSETSGSTEISTALADKANTATTYTKTEVDNALTDYATTGDVQTAVASKQDTLVSGTNIKTINNESILGSGNITIQGGGGGKAVSAGTNISITTGETADTINCTLPITVNQYNNGVTLGYGANNCDNYFSVSEGYNSKAKGSSCHAEGYMTSAYTSGSHSEGYQTCAGFRNAIGGYEQEYAHAEGYMTSAITFYTHAEGKSNSVYGQCSHAEGAYNKIGNVGGYDNLNSVSSHVEGEHNNTYNRYEHGGGYYNNSVSASTTFGDSGNTLMSVGNGNAENMRHNAFEIRQNGDIYIPNTDDTTSSNYYEKPMVRLQDTVTQTAANTTALGGLKLVKLTQSEYDALTTKDSSTLYIVTEF